MDGESLEQLERCMRTEDQLSTSSKKGQGKISQSQMSTQINNKKIVLRSEKKLKSREYL